MPALHLTMPALRIIAVVAAGAAIVIGWRWPDDTLAVTKPAAVAVVARADTPPPASESRASTPAPAPVAPATATAIATATATATATKASGTLSFGTATGPLDLQVAGALALWSPAEHRLRVLLTGEPLDPALEQQMLGYLRDERLADSGRPYGILDLQFRSDATTLDRAALTSASLTVAGSGGSVLDTANVLSSLQWTGRVQPSSSGAAAPSRLELTTAGNARSAGAYPQQQKWQLSLAVPVVQAYRPQAP